MKKIDIKKFWSLLVLFFVLSSSVGFAQGMNNNSHTENHNDYGVFGNDVSIHGLNVALIHVKNNESLARLSNNMAKIQNQLRLRVGDEISDVKEIDNQDGMVKLMHNNIEVKYELKVKRKARFLGFIPTRLTDKVWVDENGDVTFEKKSWLWKISKQENNELLEVE